MKPRAFAILGNLVVLAGGLAVLFGLPAKIVELMIR